MVNIGGNGRLRIKFSTGMSSDQFAIAAAVLCFSSAAWRFVLNNTVGKIGLSFAVEPIYVALLIIMVLLSVLTDKRRRKLFGVFVGIFVLVAAYFGMTLLMHPDYEYYYMRETVGIWDELFSPVTGCIYALLVVLLCKKADCVWTALKCSAWIDLAYYSIRVLLASRAGHWTGYDAMGNVIDTSYDLGVGYSIMFITIIFLCKYSEKKKTVDLLAMIYSLALVLNNGSRGALICFGLCVILLIVCKDGAQQRTLKQKIKVMLLICAILIFVFTFDKIIIAAGNLLSSAGLESRTINAMVSGTLLEDNGRNTITEHAVIAIQEGGLWGLGAYGDRPYIAPYYWWGYSHNIILEMMCDFGMILGPLLIAGLAAVLLRVLSARKSNAYRYVYIALFSICGKLIVSDTIWGYPQFWAILGIILLYPYEVKINGFISKKERVKWKRNVR